MAWTLTFTCPDGSKIVLDFVASTKVGQVAARLQHELGLFGLPHFYVAGQALDTSDPKLTVKKVGSNSWDVVPLQTWSITFNFIDGSAVERELLESMTAGNIAAVLKSELELVRLPLLSAGGQLLNRHDPAVTVRAVGSKSWDVVVPQHQGLSRWRDHQLKWQRVVLNYSGSKGSPFTPWAPAIGMAVPIGRDRLFISPGNMLEPGFPSMAADDFWVVGVNEVSATLDPRPEPEPPYLGVRQVAVPVELAGMRIRFHAFDGTTLIAILDDKDAAGECSLCKFHVFGALEEDLHKFALVSDGEAPKRVPFKRVKSQNYVEGTDAHVDYVCELARTYSKLPAQPFQAKYLRDQPPSDSSLRTCAVYDHDGVELGQFNVRDRFFNDAVEHLPCDSELMLVPGEDCSEDAFHGYMRLYDWREGQLVKHISLAQPGPSWLDPNRHQEGLLEGTQTFYSVRREWATATVILHLCTPVHCVDP